MFVVLVSHQNSTNEEFVKVRPVLLKTVKTWMRGTITVSVLLSCHTFLYFFVFLKSMYQPIVWIIMQSGRRLLEVLLGIFIMYNNLSFIFALLLLFFGINCFRSSVANWCQLTCSGWKPLKNKNLQSGCSRLAQSEATEGVSKAG